MDRHQYGRSYPHEAIAAAVHNAPLAFGRKGNASQTLPDVVRGTAISEASQIGLHVLPLHGQCAMAGYEGQRSGFICGWGRDRQDDSCWDARTEAPKGGLMVCSPRSNSAR